VALIKISKVDRRMLGHGFFTHRAEILGNDKKQLFDRCRQELWKNFGPAEKLVGGRMQISSGAGMSETLGRNGVILSSSICASRQQPGLYSTKKDLKMRTFKFIFEVTCVGEGQADVNEVENLIDLSMQELVYDDRFIAALDEREAVTIQVNLVK
jgi:hypothetical protein